MLLFKRTLAALDAQHDSCNTSTALPALLAQRVLAIPSGSEQTTLRCCTGHGTKYLAYTVHPIAASSMRGVSTGRKQLD
jgi:hypothetical protein